MRRLRPTGWALILSLTLSAQGVTELVPQSGFGISEISSDGSSQS